MINADIVVIGNVSGSHQLGRVLHEETTFSILAHRLLETCAVHCKCKACVEYCVLSF